jgi:indolepyruvate ferredoxin oxidoreductase
MPQWHRREREFRDWYIHLVENFHYEDRAGYDRYVKALRCVEEVRGYREVRYPKMEEARRKVEGLFSQPKKTASVTVPVKHTV